MWISMLTGLLVMHFRFAVESRDSKERDGSCVEVRSNDKLKRHLVDDLYFTISNRWYMPAKINLRGGIPTHCRVAVDGENLRVRLLKGSFASSCGKKYNAPGIYNLKTGEGIIIGDSVLCYRE